jgi:methionine sulfoxide reductase heme-binding subunit
LLDSDAGVALAHALVPGIAPVNRWPLAWGVIATYLLATAVLTSWPQRRFTRRTWRIVHLGSVVGFALVLVHALQMGTDGATAWFRAGVLLVAGVAMYALGLRLFGVLLRRPPVQDSQPVHR